uniref:Uncharacterized protein n=1 Tax=Aegilops tauschii TaxID=37682 RepID=N1QPD1_AEGTA
MGGRARRQRGAGLGGVVVAEVDSLERAEPGGRRRRKIRAREMTVAELADEVERWARRRRPVYDVPIDQLLGVPPDESDLHECWEGFGSNGGQLVAPYCLSTHDETPDTTPPETESAAHTADGPESGWRRKRGPRKRRVPLCTDQSWHLGNHFGETSHRTNNSHWTPEEVAMLVDGVEDCGVARWSVMKKKWFPTSVRTAGNLKDKWRNLLESYTGNAERSCYLHLDKKLIERIQKAAFNNPYPKPRWFSKSMA